jgi:hypothetical protein
MRINTQTIAAIAIIVALGSPLTAKAQSRADSVAILKAVAKQWHYNDGGKKSGILTDFYLRGVSEAAKANGKAARKQVVSDAAQDFVPVEPLSSNPSPEDKKAWKATSRQIGQYYTFSSLDLSDGMATVEGYVGTVLQTPGLPTPETLDVTHIRYTLQKRGNWEIVKTESLGSSSFVF